MVLVVSLPDIWHAVQGIVVLRFARSVKQNEIGAVFFHVHDDEAVVEYENRVVIVVENGMYAFRDVVQDDFPVAVFFIVNADEKRVLVG